MANLKEIRSRISSVKSTRQITSAMKMVSAAKLRKAQNRIEQLRPYADQLKHILSYVGQSMAEDKDFVYSRQRPVKNVMIVMISSNKGLCGSFNANVVKRTISEIQDSYQDANVDIFAIGSKAAEISKKHNFNIVKKETEIFDELSFETASEIAGNLMRDFVNEKYDKIICIYNSFVNAAAQRLKAERFLPVEISEEEKESSNYIFEPDKSTITRDLIPRSLKTQFFKALLDSNASEHGARMTSMQQATDNATDLLEDITLQYNKARQSAITNEILEIVSGANALKG
ncbi:MAG TPA: ATP synthase F1 subunit gamma [Bacteroidales bacterium]|nr:ATP synthase F1 subunit gamma [Bacteroidales bacterium]